MAIKIVDTRKGEHSTYQMHSLKYGDVIAGTAGGYKGFFLRTSAGVIFLNNPSVTWPSNFDLVLYGLPVDIEIHIKDGV